MRDSVEEELQKIQDVHHRNFELVRDAGRQVEMAEEYIGEMHVAEEECHMMSKDSENYSAAVRAEMTKWRGLMENEEFASQSVVTNIRYREEAVERRHRNLEEHTEAKKRLLV